MTALLLSPLLPPMKQTRPFQILFLCTGNSTHSIFGEYLIRRTAYSRFESYSAGTNPKKAIHPMTRRVLEQIYHIDCSEARSKSWEEYKDETFDFVITVCDQAQESYPLWPGQPILAHWGSPDPAAFIGNKEKTFRMFRNVAGQIQHRIELFTSLPFEKLNRMRLEALTKDIGVREPLRSATKSLEEPESPASKEIFPLQCKS